jgi:hypothetical protein
MVGESVYSLRVCERVRGRTRLASLKWKFKVAPQVFLEQQRARPKTRSHWSFRVLHRNI